MTALDMYHAITELLEKAGCDSPAFDACCLLEDIGGLPHGIRPDERCLTDEQAALLAAAAERRANGEPLQYILGQWDFLSLTLEVGKGVLIPRPDTELLCETAAEKLRDTKCPQVLDLCAGSGCVGLGLCSLLRDAQVTAVEMSEEALAFLRRNTARYPQYAVTAVKDDVCAPKKRYTPVDAVLSNPPYIPSGEIPSLMKEVQHEPRIALDGDADGLHFYRAIAEHWLPLLKKGGLLAVEVGIGQAESVKTILESAGMIETEVCFDLGGIARVVTAKKANDFS